MPLVALRFDVAGDVQLSRAFEASEREAEDMSEPLREIGQRIQRTVGEQFLTQGARAGGWQALSPRYAAWKEEHFPGRPLMVLHGDMRAAALTANAITVTPRRVTYEIDDPKALGHQQGAGPLPVRELIRLLGTDKRGFERVFAEWLNYLRHRVGGAGR